MSTTHTDGLLYLKRKDVERLCSEIDSVAIIREAFKMHALGQTVLPDEAYLSWTNSLGEPARSLNMPGALSGSFEAVGTKIINSNVANPAQRGLPRASGLTLLYDDTSARVTCIMEGAYLSSLRTACVSALAIDLLANPSINCLALIGAGALARAHVELLVHRLPHLRTIQLFEIEAVRLPAWTFSVSELLQTHNITLRIASCPEEAIRPAQLIIPTTTVTAGYIPFEWLQPGALLINVSLDDPLPEVVFKADLVVVDDWSLVSADHRRLIGRMYRDGLVLGPDETAEPLHSRSHARRIDAQLGELITNIKPGRQHPGQTILVNPFGLSIEDISLASHIYRQACAGDIGVWLEP